MLDGGGGGYTFIAKVIIFLSKRKMGNTYFVHHEFNFHNFHFNMSIDTLYIFDSLPKACPSDGEGGTSPCPPTDGTDPCDVSGL